jgi:uncharacterized membrane protein YkvA (DUF1232 family)
MTLTVDFELSDQDLQHFRDAINRAQQTAKETGADKVVGAARELLAKVRERAAPVFVRDRFDKLESLISMIEDEEWAMQEPDRDRVLSALAYFSDPQDMIPDTIPGLGFIDDAIMVELVVRELQPEIEAYVEFCRFRERGGQAGATREEWLKTKRIELQSRMRQRRRERSRAPRSGGDGNFSLWTI